MGIQAGQVEYSGLKVANANWVLGNIVADVVRFAVGTGLDAGSGHPHGKGMRVMIVPVVAFFALAAKGEQRMHPPTRETRKTILINFLMTNILY